MRDVVLYLVLVINVADVVRAIRCALAPGTRGIYNVAGPDPLPLSRAIKILGRRSLPVPYSLGRTLLKRLWTMRLTTFPAPELDHIRYVCMVDDTRARRDLGDPPDLTDHDTDSNDDAAR